MSVTQKSLRLLLTPGLAAAMLVPLGASVIGMATFEQRHEAAGQLEDSLSTAVTSYKRRQGLKYTESHGAESANEEGAKLASLAQQKRAVRLQLAAVLKELVVVRERYSIDEDNPDRLARMTREGKRVLIRAAKDAYLSRDGDDLSAEARSAFQMLMDGGHGSALETPAVDWQMQLLDGLQKTTDLTRDRDDLLARLEVLRAEYLTTDKALDRSQGIVRVSEAELQRIQQIVREVHQQVLLLQSDLARIDAQLKERAERRLIDKGLMSPQSAEDDGPTRPQFTWPAYGSLSAGFHNAKYKEYFGVPHEGADIVVGQGSPVYSAADGIVFLVREGGLTGYTYVLIGHSNGYATLYGHLSSVVITAGQRVTAGQMIGLSGGKPGTDGAGPMTTGPHLHFEVIQGGVNIDPTEVLP